MTKKAFHSPNKISQRPVVLVSSAGGFVGSYLCELLLEKNCRVIATDNLSAEKKSNLKNCFINLNFSFIDQNRYEQLKKIGQINYIFYLDEIEMGERKEDPNTLKKFVKITGRYLELAFQTKAKFLSASSFAANQSEFFKNNLNKNLFQESENHGRQSVDEAIPINARSAHKAEQKPWALAQGSLLPSEYNLNPKNFAELQNSSEHLIAQYHQKKGVNARIVRLSDAYGPRVNLHANGQVQQLLKDFKTKDRLLVAGNGSQVVYPVFVADAVYGISKAMFGAGTNGRVFNLINHRPITVLQLAQETAKRSRRPLKINFTKKSFPATAAVEQKAMLEMIEKTQAILGWKATVDIGTGIEQTLMYFENKNGSIKTKSQKPLNNSAGQKIRNFSVAIFLLTLIIFFPLISLGWNSYRGVSNLRGVKKAVEDANFSVAAKKAQSAQRSFQHAHREIQNFGFFFRWLGLEKIENRVEKIYEVGDNLSLGAIHAVAGLDSLTQIGKIVFQNQESDLDTLLRETKTALGAAYENFSLALAEAQTEKKLLPIKIPFNETNDLISKSIKAIDALPQIIGAGKGQKRTYLVLLQNNMELRPTGGFIGSFGLVTFEEGKLIDFEIQDIYSADGQLKGHVEPPAEIKKYLGEAGWYLRDVNWDPDFPTTALRAEWFLEKEIGQTVDGVVGVDLGLAQNILAQTGEIQVADYREKIGAQNLFERAEYYSQEGFFPGSQQKKNFLSSLIRTLFEKIKSSSQKDWFSLAKAFYLSGKQKDLLIYLNDPLSMKAVSDFEVDGRLKTIACQDLQINCFVDYLMIVEANLGVNKANYFVHRNLSHQIQIGKSGVIDEVLKIIYQNQGQSGTPSSGRYKNYLRVLVPKDSVLTKISIDGQELNRENISQQAIGEKGSYGFLVEVPVKEQRLVEIRYRLANKVDLSGPSKYLFLLQKQPGISDQVFSFQFSAPAGVLLFEVKPAAKQSQNVLLFSPEFKTDLVFEIGMSK